MPESAQRARIVLQARTSSQRLPAKSLLPIRGIPLAVLCGLRLAREGAELVLATSDDPSDDALADAAQAAGLAVMRGSLDDVLARFAACTEGLADEALVVRMTADNPLPDGDFAARLVAAFVAQDRTYLGTAWPDDGLPYGLGGEVFRAGDLRRAAAAASTRGEREHVTPWLRAQGSIARHPRLLEEDASALRCTVDTLADYLAMARLFERVEDPVRASWQELVAQLLASAAARAPTVPAISRAGERIGRVLLGTAQVGMPYGVANTGGPPSDAELSEMLSLAAARGVTHLDTARAYGDSEARLGAAFAAHHAPPLAVCSKLAPITLPEDAGSEAVAAAVDASVFRSCHALRRRRVEVLMFHRSADATRWQGAALRRLEALREEGVVGAIGASVYTPEEARAMLAQPALTHLQLPCNLVDARWLEPGFQAALGSRPDVLVHVRSVFLQGLLAGVGAPWPAWFDAGPALAHALEALRLRFGRASAIDLCIAYIAAQPWVGTMVLGAERSAQLAELLDAACAPPLTAEQAGAVRAALPSIPDRLLNPALW